MACDVRAILSPSLWFFTFIFLFPRLVIIIIAPLFHTLFRAVLILFEKYPEMHANEMYELHDRHHQVSPTLNPY